jgi:hypothetical protein
MDEFRDRLRDEMKGERAPEDGHARLMARVRRSDRRRRVAAAILGLALTGMLAIGGFAALRDGRGRGVPLSPSTDATSEGGQTKATPTGRPTDAPTDRTPSSEPTGGGLPDAPPAVTVSSADGAFRLVPYTYCYRTGCVDGAPRELPNVGNPERLTVEFPLEGWSFTASFTPTGDECGRVQSAGLLPVRERTFSLEPVGFADAYDVTLFGEARAGGDLFVAFRWTTPVDGPLPHPRAYLALLANDDPVTSYGVELHVSNLAETPSSERAIITVRASNGREITFEATGADRDCLPEGTVFWDGPDAKGLAAAELGQPPFTYEVELILDGVHYFASAAWPDDEIAGEEPAVLLHFSPALPALGGT